MAERPLITENCLFPHPLFAGALSRLEQSFQFASSKREPDGTAIVGPSRTGKSSTLFTFQDQHPRTRTPSGMHIPVLYMKVPSSPTVKSLAATMLEALGAPDPVKGTENDLTRRIRVLFKQTGVLMILIDEFQHFFDRGKKQIMHNVADWLKILVDDTGVTLVVAGLPTCLDVIDTNEQLAGRLSSPIHFKRFEWRDDGDRGQYMDLLAAFHKQLQPEYDVPIFDSEEMAFRFWQATGGLIGYLAKLLRQAERNAVTNKKKQITMADLHTAHMESVWMAQRLPDLPRPFLSSSLAEPTADLLERVAQIGTASEATPISNRLRVRSPKRETLHKLLGKR